MKKSVFKFKFRPTLVRAEVFEDAIRICGRADQCSEPLLRATGHKITRLQSDLCYMQTFIDKELTRRYNELVRTITNK